MKTDLLVAALMLLILFFLAMGLLLFDRSEDLLAAGTLTGAFALASLISFFFAKD